MPSAQPHEVNRVGEAHQNPQRDSINQGAIDQIMTEVNTDRDPKNIQNDHGQLPKQSLNGSAALENAQRMQERMENKGFLDFAPLFPNKSNGDGCSPDSTKQEMMRQAYEMKDKKVGGQSLKKQGEQSIESDRR
jgi:hypothetical protein